MMMKNKKNALIEYDLMSFITKKISINDNKILFSQDISVLDFINATKSNIAYIRKILKNRKLELNEILTREQIAELSLSLNLDFEFVAPITTLNLIKNIDKLIKSTDLYKNSELKRRAPIITIMGHVDHGKTTLLDYIKKSNIVSSEIGGITQKIGAYSITKNNEKITFIDTPGHEAFTQMRANGSQLTDIVVIVVAADDSIMPQTKESIDHAKAANVPIIVAINKIDKPNANIEKVINEVSDYGLMPEEWGGTTPFVKISAIDGTGVDVLLETILLQAEILDLKASYNSRATGSIVESNIDVKKGALASVIISDGILNTGDYILIEDKVLKVKAIYDSSFKKIETAFPSEAVELFGLGFSPKAGSKFVSISNIKDAKKIAADVEAFAKGNLSISKMLTVEEMFFNLQNKVENKLKIILKANSQGSLDAIKSQLLKIKKAYGEVEIIRADIGDVTNSDISLAEASNAKVFTFELSSKNPISSSNVVIKNFRIIYELIDEVNNIIDGYKKPELEQKQVGEILVLKIFESSKFGKIIGAQVISGKINNSAVIKILNNKGEVLFESKIVSLKIEKNASKEVGQGKEFGATFENMNYDFQEGQKILVFNEVEKDVQS